MLRRDPVSPSRNFWARDKARRASGGLGGPTRPPRMALQEPQSRCGGMGHHHSTVRQPCSGAVVPGSAATSQLALDQVCKVSSGSSGWRLVLQALVGAPVLRPGHSRPPYSQVPGGRMVPELLCTPTPHPAGPGSLQSH